MPMANVAAWPGRLGCDPTGAGLSSEPPVTGFIHLRSVIISLISNKGFFWSKFQWFHLCVLKSHREGERFLGLGILALDLETRQPGAE